MVTPGYNLVTPGYLHQVITWCGLSPVWDCRQGGFPLVGNPTQGCLMSPKQRGDEDDRIVRERSDEDARL